jgi:hypothetical protein
MFLCATCDNLKDADDGCEDTPEGLICIDCMEALQADAEEADTFRRANPLEPDFRRQDR